MKHSYTLARRLSVGHFLVGHPVCAGQHGHDITISMTIEGQPRSDYFMYPCLSEDQIQFNRFCNELDHRNLNDMIPAGTPSVHGLALYAWERLVMSVTGLAAIEVEIGDERSKVML